jgi:hypothetical protein
MVMDASLLLLGHCFLLVLQLVEACCHLLASCRPPFHCIYGIIMATWPIVPEAGLLPANQLRLLRTKALHQTTERRVDGCDKNALKV